MAPSPNRHPTKARAAAVVPARLKTMASTPAATRPRASRSSKIMPLELRLTCRPADPARPLPPRAGISPALRVHRARAGPAGGHAVGPRVFPVDRHPARGGMTAAAGPAVQIAAAHYFDRQVAAGHQRSPAARDKYLIKTQTYVRSQLGVTSEAGKLIRARISTGDTGLNGLAGGFAIRLRVRLAGPEECDAHQYAAMTRGTRSAAIRLVA
jgi:hypothetical protein